MRYFFILFAIAGLLINPSAAEACTGITLKKQGRYDYCSTYDRMGWK